ncbi:MAG: phosphoribosylanthranilate isomerase [Candidatus Sulfotelmatobacter sp.]
MTWVKICGMTNLEDALVAVEAGADAVGFVFYAKSPRNISVEAAREIVEKLPEGVEKVGVFVGGVPEDIATLCKESSLTVAQIYPRAPFAMNDEFLRRLQCRVIPAISTRAMDEREISGFRVSNGVRNQVVAALLDSGNSEVPGGTGKTPDWEMVLRLTERIGLRVVLAGGLTAQNIEEAVGKVKPWGVDVSSGVEARPGKKDPEKVRGFVRAVREMDRKLSTEGPGFARGQQIPHRFAARNDKG